MTQPQKPAHVLVIGAGSWGSALAALAARQQNTLLYSIEADQAAYINRTHQNPDYLGETLLPETLRATADQAEAIAHLAAAPDRAFIILAVPVIAMRRACAEWARLLEATGLAEVPIVWTCKGFEASTGLLIHELFTEVAPQLPNWGALSGPSFALEVAQGLPVAMVCASLSDLTIQRCTEALHGSTCRIYGVKDVLGVEVGGALKNIMAVACGVSDGLGLGDNVRAALITRGLAEIIRFGKALGAQEATFSGLSGLGDLVLTATGNLSRNRQLGLALGHGHTLEELLEKGITVEGANCAHAVYQRALQLGIEMPVTHVVCQVLDRTITPEQAVDALYSRKARNE